MQALRGLAGWDILESGGGADLIHGAMEETLLMVELVQTNRMVISAGIPSRISRMAQRILSY